MTWKNVLYPAEVKKSEPTKKVTPTTLGSTSPQYGGNEPSANRNEPTMNSAAIRHPRSRGRHDSSRRQRISLLSAFRRQRPSVRCG